MSVFTVCMHYENLLYKAHDEKSFSMRIYEYVGGCLSARLIASTQQRLKVDVGNFVRLTS